MQMISTQVEAIRCIDCGVIISQHERAYDVAGNWISSSWTDTIARAGATDMLRCGPCCRKLLWEGLKNG
jgi:DNA-directed RNA polymerase subunit N (RpoN/RPB10)